MRYARFLAAAAMLAASAVSAGSPSGARDLRLAPDLSFTDDSSANFPIRGVNLAAGELATDRPTVVFFGTSHCFNTNREAERFVAFAARHRDDARFLVVDLDHVAGSQEPLVSRFYRGYIPTLAFVSGSGAVVYDRSGETSSRRGDAAALEAILARTKAAAAAR
jgi:hypothetical protein